LLDGYKNNTNESTNTNKEIHLIHLPDLVCSLNVNKANDGCDYNGGKNDVRGVNEEGHEEEESHHHSKRHYYVGHCSLTPSIIVHSRTGKGSWGWDVESEYSLLGSDIILIHNKNLHELLCALILTIKKKNLLKRSKNLTSHVLLCMLLSMYFLVHIKMSKNDTHIFVYTKNYKQQDDYSVLLKIS